MTNKMVKTRFAPSPTGYLHVGGARTALFSYLYAKKMGGQFVLRIEDTDTARNSPEAVKAIFDGMNWLGLHWDEGPGCEVGDTKYFQTERLDVYAKYTQQLLDAGKAYKCYRSREELTHLRTEAEARGLKGYQREWSVIPKDVEAKYVAEKRPFVIRFRSPNEGVIVVDDLVHGEVKFNVTDMVDDFVLVKEDGIPTYNYAVVIDDATMAITHVIRGDDHLANTPKQIALYEALGFELPRFGHIPMILGEDKQKLSKRHGAVSVLEYDAKGYLPHALVNYLARLGWSHGDQEIFSMEELISLFSLEALNKTAAVFDTKKLNWLNKHYLNLTSSKELIRDYNIVGRMSQHVSSELVASTILQHETGWLNDVVEVLRTRSGNLNELAKAATIFTDHELVYDLAAVEKHLNEQGLSVVREVIDLIETGGEFTPKGIEAVVESYAALKQLKVGAIAQPLRVALTGGTASPGIGDTLFLLGLPLIKKRVAALVSTKV